MAHGCPARSARPSFEHPHRLLSTPGRVPFDETPEGPALPQEGTVAASRAGSGVRVPDGEKGPEMAQNDEPVRLTIILLKSGGVRSVFCNQSASVVVIHEAQCRAGGIPYGLPGPWRCEPEDALPSEIAKSVRNQHEAVLPSLIHPM